MADFIFVHGAPGTGKSSLAKALQASLHSPWFEFGWIPEFRQKRDVLLTYKEEESFTFDTLTLVVKHYVRHGFENVILSDLRDPKVREIPRRFARYRWLLVTLWMDDEETLKARVLDENRSSGYRDWQASLAMNHLIRSRPLMTNEVRINSTRTPVEEIVAAVVRQVERLDQSADAFPKAALPARSHFAESEF